MEKNYDVEMNMIVYAGNSKTASFQAIEAAETAEYEKAAELLKTAKEQLNEAHHAHSDMLTRFSSGEDIDMNLLLVHAMDHLNSAEIIYAMAEKFIALYKKFN